MAHPACSPFRPLTNVGLILTSVGLLFLIIAVARPFFIVQTIGALGITIAENDMGAFQVCQSSASGLTPSNNNGCHHVDQDCNVEDSNDGLEGCTTFNTFRGLLVMGILFIFFYIIASTFVLFSLRTSVRLWRMITLVLGIIALACIGISIFSLVGYKNDYVPSGEVPGGSFSTTYGYSFALECVGVALFTIGLFMWFFGTGREGLESAAPGQYQQFNEPPAATATAGSGFATQQQPGYASYAGYP